MDLKDLWTRSIKEISQEIDRVQVLTWFKNTAVLSLANGEATIGLPLAVFLSWHATHLSRKTLSAIQKIDPSVKTIKYEIDLSLGNEKDPRTVDLAAHFTEKSPRKLPGKNEVKMADGLVGKQFNPKYTLDRFIVSPENRLAHAAAMNVAKYPGKNYNPLFIYGGVGLGKTHLLQGVGQEILRNDPNRVVLYITSETFVNDVVGCIQARNMDRLRAKYRKVDALIIDDIQFMANKDRSQEEFFHTFNTLYDSGKQIILSSDQAPQGLTLMDARLRSRFESGMIVDVKMPDFETRLAILQERCREAQIFINQQVLEFIAYNADHSVRALEGVLRQAIAKYELENTAPTVKMVSEIIKHTKKDAKMVGFIPNNSTPHTAVTIERLIDCASDYYTVPKTDVMGDSRVSECMVPRQVIMYLAKTKLKMSLAKIGENLGNRNHTTVMHAIGRIQSKMKNDRQLLCDVNAIASEVGIAA